eukprot:2134856-Pyramimonas_sp.AAC.1
MAVSPRGSPWRRALPRQPRAGSRRWCSVRARAALDSSGGGPGPRSLPCSIGQRALQGPGGRKTLTYVARRAVAHAVSD